MIRTKTVIALSIVAGLAGLPALAFAQASSQPRPSATPAKPAAAAAASSGTGAAAAANQAAQLEASGAWGAYASQQGRAKYCYALSQPKDRAPATLNRDPGYLFVSIRPAEKVKGEVAFVFGFPSKDDAGAKATIGDKSFDIVTKDGKGWLRNPAEEPQFVTALAAGAEMKVDVTSGRGNKTTDTYSLTGFTKSWDRIQKECP